MSLSIWAQTEKSATDTLIEHGSAPLEHEDAASQELDSETTQFRLFLEEIRSREAEGERLFGLRQYREAFPHLQTAAQNGFKIAQVRLAFLFANGLGGVERDVETALAWFGVAAEPPTHPKIQRHFIDQWRILPGEWKEYLQQVIDAHIERYGSEAAGVSCEMVLQAESDISQLRCGPPIEMYAPPQEVERAGEFEVETGDDPSPREPESGVPN